MRPAGRRRQPVEPRPPGAAGSQSSSDRRARAMSPLPLLTVVLAAAAAAADTVPSRLCALIYREPDPSFERISLSGTTQCRCESASAASCLGLDAYPTVAPNSPESLLSQYHQPSGSAVQSLLAYQIQLTCRSYRAGGRRCRLTWPADGRGAPVCDCAAADGQIAFKAPYYIDHIRSRAGATGGDGEQD
ncbi:uncharacterized protein LOC122377490 [Amphibalanus amphitrite]|uniref:uncharacterized protein LOC122377490 n=1 Tax=Amphibalanus amphitrite TaxID=1232801 RepID=UPI001C9251A1|nr:uncharacterized protein LOC122377490 [Amphibalanus amphitrite]